MPKILLNCTLGGFALSDEAMQRWAALRGLQLTGVAWGEQTQWKVWYRDGCLDDDHLLDYQDIARDDPLLLQVVEELGLQAAAGHMSSLRIATVPDDVDWFIDDHDGIEIVRERHRTW